MSTVIKVENLSKQYRLGQIGTGTISHDINRWWQRLRGNEDPYLKIGETNDRTQKGNSEYVWVLRDINFKVQQGEVLGIIGRNGAGKSTLLKILSRTTAPTIGTVKIKGRVASLLEVGTGFHPELSGRDNVYLNGAILGMTRLEIKSKFDEIVDFAGVERYIDTPVKRYSSGMYVRLAFAVAAYLEPEILIVDEVLAVGDVDFQEKCIGKMKSVSTDQGRTVLFVSHNIQAVKSLCKNVMIIDKGNKKFEGLTSEGLSKYLEIKEIHSYNYSYRILDVTKVPDKMGGDMIQICSVELLDSNFQNIENIHTGQSVLFRLGYKINDSSVNYDKIHFSVSVKNSKGDTVVIIQSHVYNGFFDDLVIKNNNYVLLKINHLPFLAGNYYLSFDIINQKNWTFLHQLNDAMLIKIERGLIYGNRLTVEQGLMIVDSEWSI
jgi:lipopolysaccharide transport system ATP-binding protein